MIQSWFVNGLLAAMCFAGMVLACKKLLLMGVKPLVLNLFLFGLTFVGFLLWNIIQKNSLVEVSPKMFFFFLVAALFALLANYFDANAIKMAPNPGYSATLKSCQIVIIALLSPFLFGSALTIYSFIGMACVILGIFLIGK